VLRSPVEITGQGGFVQLSADHDASDVHVIANVCFELPKADLHRNTLIA